MKGSLSQARSDGKQRSTFSADLWAPLGSGCCRGDSFVLQSTGRAVRVPACSSSLGDRARGRGARGGGRIHMMCQDLGISSHDPSLRGGPHSQQGGSRASGGPRFPGIPSI